MAFDDGIKTVSGLVAHTDDAATKVPFVSVKCGIEPTLDGVSHIVETQTGKNLLDTAIAETKSNNSVSVTCDGKGKYTATGTATGGSANITFTLKSPCEIKSGMYLHLMSSPANANVSLTIQRQDNTSIYSPTLSPANRIIDLSSYVGETIYSIRLYVVNNASSDLTFSPMLCYSNTATTFEPYQTPTQYTALLGRTIHGGTADIVNGVGKNRYAKLSLAVADMNNSETYPGWKNSGVRAIVGGGINKPITDGVTTVGQYYNINTNGTTNDIIFLPPTRYNNMSQTDWKTQYPDLIIEILVEIPTPTDFTFTPITPTPETVGKVNNVYCNTGNTELTYYDNAHGFSEVTVNKTGKNLISAPIFTPSTPTLCFDAGRDITVSNITMSFLATNAVVQATNAAIVDYRKEDGTHTYRTLNWFRDANNNQFTANTPQNGKFKNSDSNITFRYIYIYYESITYSMFESDCISEWQIELASTASDYTPYEAVSKTAYLHKVIYGGQADVVKGTCEPKNLAEFSNADNVNRDSFSYTTEKPELIEWTKTGSGGKFYARFILHIPKPGKYTISCTNDSTVKAKYIYSDELWGTSVYSSVSTNPFVAEFSASGNYVMGFYAGSSATSGTLGEVMCEEGETQTSYAPYFAPFSFPPINMETDEGENTLYAGEGDSAITYRKAVD